MSTKFSILKTHSKFVIFYYFSYAQLLMKLGKFIEAKQFFSDALDIYTQIHGKDNTEVVMLLNNLSAACTNASRQFM